LPEQVRERLMPVFERLGRDELTREDTQRLANFARPQPAATFRMLDVNGDGKLTVDEAPEGMRFLVRGMLRRADKADGDSLTREEFEKLVPRQATRPASGKSLFSRLDTNNDGKLTREELSRAADLFSTLDTNQDGVLSPRELMGDAEDTQARASNPAAGPFFQRLDTNNDGSISQEEAPPRIKQNFEKLDTNGDGKLSPAEFRAGYQKLMPN
jgi:Ca2+-binding EF-hand superfamily protein